MSRVLMELAKSFKDFNDTIESSYNIFYIWWESFCVLSEDLDL